MNIYQWDWKQNYIPKNHIKKLHKAMNLKIFGPTWNDNYLELLLLKTMKLLGSTEKKITKYKNGENTSRLETTKVFLVHCNTDNNDYQYDSLCKVQTNLEKSGKPGKTDLFEKSQGNSGKI